MIRRKPCLGSSALFGQLRPDDLSLKHYLTGMTLRETMKRAGAEVNLIQQGLPLEMNCPIAIVSAIRSNYRNKPNVCVGEPGHSGAFPQTLRHDAVLATADLLVRIEKRWIRHLKKGEDLVVTSGIVSTNPVDHSYTRVPGEVFFSLEIRSQDETTLKLFHQWMIDESRRVEIERGVRFEFGSDCHFSPVLLDKVLINRRVRLLKTLN